MYNCILLILYKKKLKLTYNLYQMETLDPYNDTANEQQQQEQLNSSDDVESLTSEKIYTYDYANQEDGNNGGQFSELGSESGVEPDYTEWVFDEKAVVEDEFDITNEQALATLKFFCECHFLKFVFFLP